MLVGIGGSIKTRLEAIRGQESLGHVPSELIERRYRIRIAFY